jgi:hypothetical protein
MARLQSVVQGRADPQHGMLWRGTVRRATQAGLNAMNAAPTRRGPPAGVGPERRALALGRWRLAADARTAVRRCVPSAAGAPTRIPRGAAFHAARYPTRHGIPRADAAQCRRGAIDQDCCGSAVRDGNIRAYRRCSTVNGLCGGAQVSCGSKHSMLLLESGALYCWGWGGDGQVGSCLS